MLVLPLRQLEEVEVEMGAFGLKNLIHLLFVSDPFR